MLQVTVLRVVNLESVSSSSSSSDDGIIQPMPPPRPVACAKVHFTVPNLSLQFLMSRHGLLQTDLEQYPGVKKY